MNTKAIVKKAFIKSLPVMAAYVILGMGFGILMNNRGYGVLWPIACSLFIYAGSMQYVTADLLAAAVSPLYAAVMTLTVNARHLFYGISMVGKYRNMGRFKPYLIFGLTDETYSLLCDDKEYPSQKRDAELYCFLVTLFNHAYWMIGTALGAILGAVAHFNSTGIEFSMTALFVTVFVEQWMTSREHRSSLTGIGAALGCLIVFGESNFLIPTMVLISALLSLTYGKRKRGGSRD